MYIVLDLLNRLTIYNLNHSVSTSLILKIGDSNIYDLNFLERDFPIYFIEEEKAQIRSESGRTNDNFLK